MQYVISGGAGFIGSHLCDFLVERGANVVVIDNLITGSRDNIQHLLGHRQFRFIEGDVTNPQDIDGPVDHVIHMASLASPRDYLAHPIETLESGSTGTRNMLEVARAKGASFLLTSTSECYGDPLEHPQKETYWGNVNPVGPRSCYDESKRYAEAVTMAYHRVHGVRTSIARIFNTYGPRMQLQDGRVVPAFLEQVLRGEPLTIYGDGTQTRSFCYVSDLVLGLYLLSESGEPYPMNLGNPHEITISQFAEAIRHLAGAEERVRYEPLPQDDPKRRQPDINRAQQLLSWQPQVPLEQGLRQTLEYFRARIGIAAA